MRLWDLLFRRDAAERPAEVRALSGAGDGRQLAPAAPVVPFCAFAAGMRPEATVEAPVRVLLDINGAKSEFFAPKQSHLIFVDGHRKPFHHTCTAADGTWVYAPVSRGNVS